jgi:DNA-binding MarR family transcriptional regulator
MTDLSSDIVKPVTLPPRAAYNLANGEGLLIDLVELLFFAYRDFTGDPDAILAEFQFGRAHHRILHFVDRHPGLRVADLLDILKITKQSLARVLRQLVANGFVEQRLGEADRRERRLYTTATGRELARRLLAPQIERMRMALRNTSGDTEPQLVEAFLFAMIEPAERRRVQALLDERARIASEPRGEER